MTQQDKPDPANDNAGEAPRAAAPCAICGKPQKPENKPFCSPRCADIDLGRWLDEAYAVPEKKPEDEDEGDQESDRAGDA